VRMIIDRIHRSGPLKEEKNRWYRAIRSFL
jgi:hypothetical protein